MSQAGNDDITDRYLRSNDPRPALTPQPLKSWQRFFAPWGPILLMNAKSFAF
jgi:hypothetical protein